LKGKNVTLLKIYLIGMAISYLINFIYICSITYNEYMWEYFETSFRAFLISLMFPLQIFALIAFGIEKYNRWYDNP